MRRVVEVIRRGRRGNDGASGIISVLRQTENITLSANNRGFAIVADAAITIALPEASAIGQGWSCMIRAENGTVTITSTSPIEGSSGDLVLPQGYSIQLLTDGAEFFAQFYIDSAVATVNSNGVANQSTVPGANVTAALNQILSLLGGWGKITDIPLLASFDAIDTPAGLYRFASTTTGTRGAGWAGSDAGIALVVRENDTSLTLIALRLGVLWTRTFASSAWEAWAKVTHFGLSQAEAQNASSTTLGVVSGQRLAQAAAVAITTAAVLNATSGATAGGVGSYAYLARPVVSTVTVGTTLAGSNLRYAGHLSLGTFNDSTASAISATAPAGTWRAMGEASNNTNRLPITLWLRIS